MKNRFNATPLLATLVMFVSGPAAHSVPLYWDLNGTTANTAVAVTGNWNGTTANWNTASSGTGGAARAATLNSDDLVFSSGTNLTAGTVTASGTRVASSVTFEDNVAVTLAGPFTVGGTGTKSGIFSTSTAASTVSGTVTLATAATIQTGAGALNCNGPIILGVFPLTIASTGAGRLTIAGVMSGTSAVTVTGSSTGDYVPGPGGLHTYTGGTTLSTGSFTAVGVGSTGVAGSPDNGPFGAGAAPLVFAGGQIRSGNASSFVVGNTLTLAADTTFYTTSNEKSLVFSGPMTITGATRTLTSTVGTTVAGTAAVFNGAIGEAASGLGLIKAGAGNLTLNGTNTYTGNTTINAGVLSIGNTAALPGWDTNGRFAVASGATLAVQNGVNDTDAKKLLDTGNFANGAFIGFDTSVGNRTHTLNLTDTTQGVLGLNKQGANTLILTGNNSYTGTNIVTLGTLQFATPGSLYLGDSTAWTATNLSVASGATLAVNFGGGSDFSAGQVATLLTNLSTVNSNGLKAGAAFGFDTTNAIGDATFSQVLANSTGTGGGALGFTKLGSGTLVLDQPGTYTGQTTVAQGTLTLSGGRSVAAGNISVGTVPNQPAIMSIPSGDITVGGAFSVGTGDSTVSGTLNQTGGILRTIGGTQMIVGNGVGGTTPGTTASGTYNLSGGTMIAAPGNARGVILGVNSGATGTLNLSGTGNLALALSNVQVGRSDSSSVAGSSGVFNQTGGTAAIGYLTVAGGGTTHTATIGTVNLTGGSCVVTNFTQFGSGASVTGQITIGGTAQVTLPAFPTARGAGSTATLFFDGGTLLPATASTAYLGGLTNAFIKAGGAQFNVGSAKDITVSQALLPDGGSPGGGLTKLGAGTLTLSGDSTYTGLTTVSAGTLTITGSLVGTSGLTVSSGSHFHYLPFTSAPLTLGSGSLTLANNSTIAATFGATITTATAAITSGTVNVALTGAFTTGTTYAVLSAAGGLSGASYNFLNPTDYTFTASIADTLLQVTPTTATPLAEAYWTGGFSGNPGVWAASNGSTGSNWKTGVAGSVTPLVPGTAASIVFDGTGNQLNMTLGSSMAINGLSVTGTNDLSLLRDGVSALTIGSVGITVSAGVGAVTLNPDLVLGSAQTWLHNGSNPLTLGGTVSNGSNQLIIDGSGTTTIANFNGGTGGLWVKAGATTLTTASNNGTQTWTNDSSSPLTVGALTAGNAVLTLAGSGTTTIGSVTNNTTSFGLAVGAGNAEITGIISGAGSLAKSGTGILTLSGANTYTGATTLSAGIIVPTTAMAFGTTDLGTAQSGTSEIRLNGGLTIAEPLTINGGGITNLGTLRNYSGDNTWAATVTMAAQSRINSDSGTLTLSAPVAVAATNLTLVLGGAGNITIPGSLALGTGGVAKDGTGTITLSGANTYGGATKIDSGTLIASGTSTATGAITVGNSATLPAVINVVSTGTLKGSTINVGAVASGTGAVNLTGGNLLLSAQETTDTIAFGGAEGAYGALNMSSGVFTQSRLMFGGIGTATTLGGLGVGLVSGGTINSNGWFILARAGASTGILTVTGGTINHANAAQALSIGLAGSGRAELNVAGGLIDNTGRNVTFSSGTTGAFHWTGTGLLNLNAGTLVTNAVVYDADVASKDASSYINFCGGTLKAATSNTAFLPAFTSAGAGINRVLVHGPFGTFAGGAVIDTNGFDATIGANLLAPTGNGVTALTIDAPGSGYIGAPAVKILDGGQPSTATAYAVVGTDASNPDTFGKLTSVVITNPGVILGEATVSLVGGGGSGAAVSVTAIGENTSGGMTKTGAGTLSLNGTNTYTGTTNVNVGTLAGTGSVAGPLVVAAGAAIAPGASAGTFTTGATTITGTYVCEIDGAAADKLMVNGALNVSAATLDLNVLAGGATEPAYVIASYTGSTPAPFLTVLDPIPNYTLVYNYNDGVSSNHIALVKSTSPYNIWASGYGLDPATDGAPNFDKDGDGQSNAVEYALGGSPISGSNHAKIFSLVADGSVDVDTTNELLLTIAVRSGTPVFSGTPSPTAAHEGVTYRILGSTTLSSFPATVTPVGVVVPPAPNATPPAGYEYRTFSLDGSNGLPSKGFLRVEIAP